MKNCEEFMKFTKMHGAGNDFVIVNLIEESIPVEKLSSIAARLCTPKLSIGADGLMAVCKADEGVDADYKMLFYNSDGGVGEMCGNGARCIARYGYENGLAGETQRIQTASGVVIGTRMSERLYRVRLNSPSLIELDCDVEHNDVRYKCSYIELGVPGLPHAVVRCDGLADADLNILRETGRALRFHKAFPKGANVNFYEVQSRNHALIRTFERGVEDFTLACGTGSGSTAIALALMGLVGDGELRITNPGGDLFISLVRDGDEIKDVFLTGPTNVVATGTVLDEDMEI